MSIVNLINEFRHTGEMDHSQPGAGLCSQMDCFPVICPIQYYTYSFIFCYRNQSYHTRIQLAILDHNAHLDRQHVLNEYENYMYCRKLHKQTKKWDITPTLSKKKYDMSTS